METTPDILGVHFTKSQYTFLNSRISVKREKNKHKHTIFTLSNIRIGTLQNFIQPNIGIICTANVTLALLDSRP
jgi:hypothetical protein